MRQSRWVQVRGKADKAKYQRQGSLDTLCLKNHYLYLERKKFQFSSDALTGEPMTTQYHSSTSLKMFMFVEQYQNPIFWQADSWNSSFCSTSNLLIKPKLNVKYRQHSLSYLLIHHSTLEMKSQTQIFGMKSALCAAGAHKTVQHCIKQGNFLSYPKVPATENLRNFVVAYACYLLMTQPSQQTDPQVFHLQTSPYQLSFESYSTPLCSQQAPLPIYSKLQQWSIAYQPRSEGIHVTHFVQIWRSIKSAEWFSRPKWHH